MTEPPVITPVILCGGSGTRLWPLSRQAYPKQFLALDSQDTMLQDTILRFSGAGFRAPLFVCSEEHRFIVAEQVRRTDQASARIILEPTARSTAPAAALAALTCLADNPNEDPLLLISPADHVVRDAAGLRQSVLAAAAAARAGSMVVFGVEPRGPETAYGYIQADAVKPRSTQNICKVLRFTEKPSRDLAQSFLADGRYFWNSGIFLCSARHYLSELDRHRPDILAVCEKAVRGRQADMDFLRVDKDCFSACPADAIDTAVMEKTDRAEMLAIDVGWNDVGTWSALWDLGQPDENQNIVRGRAFPVESRNSYIRTDGPLIATLGVSDLLVVASDDAVLVSSRDRAQDLRVVVEALRNAGCEETEQSRTTHRPWGLFRRVDVGTNFQVKHVMVNPGASLSLQMHRHRAEHWVVVSGTARITRGDEVFTLIENQSTYIPSGTRHRLENTGAVPLSLIEIQCGHYLGEDDIIRFEDRFGRT